MVISWMMDEVDLKNPAHRVRRYNLAKELLQQGHDIRIISGFKDKGVEATLEIVKGSDVIVWTDLGPIEEACSKAMKGTGVCQVFDHCEALWEFEHEREIMDAVDLITCSSTILSLLTIRYGFDKVAAIRDPLESYHPTCLKKHAKSEGLKAVYMGARGHDQVCLPLRPFIEKAGYELVIISGGKLSTHDWHFHTWAQDLLECDVALAIQDVARWPAKSNIKATVPMALGLPVLASPMHAYTEIVRDGVNGFVCKKPEDWYERLCELKNPDLRQSFGIRGHREVATYTLEYIASEWLDAARRTLRRVRDK